MLVRLGGLTFVKGVSSLWMNCVMMSPSVMMMLDFWRCEAWCSTWGAKSSFNTYYLHPKKQVVNTVCRLGPYFLFLGFLVMSYAVFKVLFRVLKQIQNCLFKMVSNVWLPFLISCCFVVIPFPLWLPAYCICPLFKYRKHLCWSLY